jgi:RNA polymerase sigma-70 factor, ECF subfamily
MSLELLKFQGLIKAVVTNVAGHCLCQSDIQDLVQDTNMKVLTNTFDPARGSMAGWVSTIAHNLAVSALRRTSRHAIPDSDALEDAEVGIGDIDVSDPNADDVLYILAREQKLAKIQSLLSKLDPDDQHFLIVSMRDDFDAEAYAKKLGVTPVALRVRKHRLGERLRAMLAVFES